MSNELIRATALTTTFQVAASIAPLPARQASRLDALRVDALFPAEATGARPRSAASSYLIEAFERRHGARASMTGRFCCRRRGNDAASDLRFANGFLIVPFLIFFAASRLASIPAADASTDAAPLYAALFDGMKSPITARMPSWPPFFHGRRFLATKCTR